ncbi:hypothetical protein [Clostridium akagii]|uniref:hypothetical protein n=1 Tax=Clostridium akagii TaxID=91623 RepID=UPI00047EE075|nr:hypothetical protein [Clostridium akagii]
MIPQYYFNSLSRQMPLSTETPILPLENDDEIFDNRQQPGGTAGTNSPGSTNPTSPTMSPEYTQGYLQTQIGKRIRAQFLIGSNSTQDRVGILTKVGISYIIIQNEDTNTAELCDLYSVKFVDIY